MKFKKSLFILILAVFLISIAGVCASDVNDTQMASQENAAIESTDENLITVEDIEPTVSTASNDEILSAGVDDEIVGAENDLDELRANPSTYSGLSSEIGSGGDIVLTHDYYTYDKGSTIVISIDNSVIDGKGAIIDMAGSNMRAFNVTASGVTIKNLTIQNGNVSDNGGAIYFKNAGTVENCNFVNNNVSNLFGKGGAVYFNGTGNVINCNFTDNYGGYGGAVYFSTNGDVSGCSFVNNTAIISGGAVLIKKGGVVTDCNFTNNFAVDGSAILIDGEGIVENCIFVNNSVGSAVFIEEEGKLENCIFVNNSAEQYGGAVILDSSGTIQNCNFTDNQAEIDGGAIYIEVYGIVENCIFVNNNATRYGGAICFYEEGDVTDCIFVNNSANVGGALLIFENADVTNCNFTNNTASRAGALYFNMGGEVTDCIFTNNTAGDYGGAVWFTYEGIVENCIFVNNNAAQDGGAVYFYSAGEVNNCNFTNNNATRYGGAVYFYSAGEVNNCNFTNNNAEYGGAIDFDDDATVENCIFTNNSGKYGGAVFFYTAGDVTNCNFTNNSAGSNGGAVFINEKGIVENCNFIKNSAKDGGALFINGTAGVTNCNFTDNQVNETQGHGGAIYWYGTNGNVSGCSFVNNSAMNAAAIWWQADDGVVSGCSFVNNSATDHGGAILWYGDNGNVSGCSFVNNYVKYYGGSIFWNGTAGGLVSDCSFVNNYGYNGGALFLDAGAGALVSDCTFANNLANWGGAIFCDSCVGDVVSGCSFVNNTAGVGGAVCWWSSNEGLVHDCSFVNNSVRYYGAAIYWRGNDGKVSGCSFVNNSKYSTIYFYNNENISHNLSINDNIFLNNTGVVIYFVNNDSSSNVDYNWFGNNATDYDMAPATINVVIDNWLFLNATANPDAISVSESSDILFKLYSYSEEDNGISDYDNSKLPAVNLTLTANNGDVNESTVALGDSVEYTYNGGGDASVTAAIENAKYTIVLNIAKADSILVADDLAMAYRDGSKWNLTLTDANGNAISGRAVKIGIKNKTYTLVTDENGVVGLAINLIAGTYDINATFEGDGDYEASFVNATVTVTQAVATLSGVDLNMTYKDGSVWAVTLTNADGDAIAGVKVAIGVAGKVYYIKTDDEGVAKLPINLPANTYTVNASFTNSQYEAELITATIIVNKAVPVLSAEDLVMNCKDGSAWNVTLKDAQGNAMANTYVKLTVAGKTYNRKTNSEGVVSLPINLGVGNYNITALFSGSANFDAVEITNAIVVNPPEYNFFASDVNMTYQDGTNYMVHITDGDGNPVAKAGVVIKMTINGKSYNRKTNEEGIASLPIGLRAGTYTITAEYNGRQITNTIVVN